MDDYSAEEWDEERQAELERAGLPETEALWCMAVSLTTKTLTELFLNFF